LLHIHEAGVPAHVHPLSPEEVRGKWYCCRDLQGKGTHMGTYCKLADALQVHTLICLMVTF